ncbi:MAG: hypothetical protein JRN09_07015 [Nitrososphaerota archaeon]|nr:hypothetical protein [Nitrososphaerota archaeon]
MVIALKVSKAVDDRRFMVAILETLKRYHSQVTYDADKPRLSSNWQVRIEGKGEEVFENSFRTYASTAGWQVEYA